MVMSASAITAWATVALDVATLALVAVAWMQVVRDKDQEQSRLRSVDARASAVAYRLRRDLGAWLGDRKTRDALEAWLRKAMNGPGLETEIMEAEQSMMELAQLAPEASEPVAGAVRRALTLFFLGTDALREYARTSHPDGAGDFFAWTELLDSADRELREVRDLLENGVINHELRDVERGILQTRQAKSFDTLVKKALREP